MKKKTKKNIIFAVGFLLGLSILLYPTVSNKWNAYRAKRLISTYTDHTASEKSNPEEYEQMLQDIRDYNKNLVQESVPDAFSIRDGIQDDVYDALLHINDDGVMGSLEIPSIGENLPIYHYTTEESLEKGVGHLFGSSLPIGGESTHAVLSAHRGLPSAKLFTDLPLLEEGDIFYVHVLGDTLAYEIDQIQTVEPQEVSSLAIVDGEDYVTLITCTPYAVNTHRLLVRGHRIPFVQEKYAEEQHQVQKKDTHQVWMQLVCAGIGLLSACIIVWMLALKEKREQRRRRRVRK